MIARPALLAAALAGVAGSAAPYPDARVAPPRNAVLGTWRMVAATLEQDGRVTHPYGPRPAGMLVFTADRHFVEVLTDPATPRFASDRRGGGSDAENRRAMAAGIGFFGTYAVDRDGRFAGNRVEGATFPNWVGAVRDARALRLEVAGDRMTETFTRPDGGRLRAVFRRVTQP
ncbi:lipocalin-like domain-containing protein [Sphingomonas sp. BK235]|uniref:lipocalin-like domain-containing protein n=1 Tax=Sphingomonas sp. BK235 TaxID=2512131 RepID=UPI00104C34FF|nr:lipocalin-like domain-containing protein [Sphingomonas sp. BK235]TCP33650.1 lipocalin-like protein [Sphingomonas sp. BK235]